MFIKYECEASFIQIETIRVKGCFSTNWEICIVPSLLKDEKEEAYSNKISFMMIGRLRGTKI